MASVDRNAANSQRLRRNAQRGRAGAMTGSISVTSPLQNTGSSIQLNLFSTGGLTNSSGQLTIKLNGTSLALAAAGVSVNLKTTSGLQIASGLGIILDTTPALQLLAGGLSVLLDATPGLQRTSGLKVLVDPAGGLSVVAAGVKIGVLTTKGDLVGFGTAIARLGVGADTQVLTADSTQPLGVKWAAGGGGLAASNFVFNEVPTGTLNGVNVTFTLANTPTSGTVRLYKNGQRLAPTGDYSIATATLTMVVAPLATDVLLADYMK